MASDEKLSQIIKHVSEIQGRLEDDEKIHYKVKWKEENNLIQNKLDNAKGSSKWVTWVGRFVVLQIFGTFGIKIWKCIQAHRRVVHARRVMSYWKDALKQQTEGEGMVNSANDFSDLDVVGGVVDMGTAKEEIRIAQAELGDELLSVVNSVIRIIVFGFVTKILVEETKVVTPPSRLFWKIAEVERNEDSGDITYKDVDTGKPIILEDHQLLQHQSEKLEYAVDAWTDVIYKRFQKTKESEVLLEDGDIDDLFSKNTKVQDLIHVWNEKVVFVHPRLKGTLEIPSDEDVESRTYAMFPALQKGKNLERSFVEWLAVFMGLLI